VNRENAGNDLFVKNGCFALNTLAAKHEPLAVAFFWA
jgi:cob(II)yrinic acid a,c-diamide reductase